MAGTRGALCAVFALLIGVVSPSPAGAWSNQGHMVTGAIAFDDLAQSNPALISAIEKIMESHPDRARFDRGLAGLTGQARARRLFELMARWPDDARGGAFDHPAWHYWLRVVPSRADPIQLPPKMLALTAGEAVEAYAVNLATVRDAFAPASERAVALCWVFHLGGDIQQPLHAGHLVSKRFAMSDRGGESDFVRGTADGVPINLHEYWDNTIGGDEDGQANVEAVSLRLGREWTRARLPELTGRAGPAAFRAWADESLSLAQATAYENGGFEGSARAETAPVVTPAYAANRVAVGEHRIALGGHRIADAVREALGT